MSVAASSRAHSGETPTRAWPSRIARGIVTAPILVYSKLISPALPRRCKYEPTCSAYAIEAVRSYGPARGIVLAAWRLLRCNPFSDGGFDPVEAQHVFSGPPRCGPRAQAGGR